MLNSSLAKYLIFSALGLSIVPTNIAAASSLGKKKTEAQLRRKAESELFVSPRQNQPGLADSLNLNVENAGALPHPKKSFRFTSAFNVSRERLFGTSTLATGESVDLSHVKPLTFLTLDFFWEKNLTQQPLRFSFGPSLNLGTQTIVIQGASQYLYRDVRLSDVKYGLGTRVSFLFGSNRSWNLGAGFNYSQRNFSQSHSNLAANWSARGNTLQPLINLGKSFSNNFSAQVEYFFAEKSENRQLPVEKDARVSLGFIWKYL